MWHPNSVLAAHVECYASGRGGVSCLHPNSGEPRLRWVWRKSGKEGRLARGVGTEPGYQNGMEVWSGLEGLVASRVEALVQAMPFPTLVRCAESAVSLSLYNERDAVFSHFFSLSTMGRKLDPTKKEKRGPGRKARKQKGAETELARFLPAGTRLYPFPSFCPSLFICIVTLHFLVFTFTLCSSGIFFA